MKFKLLFVLLIILLIVGCTQPSSLDTPKTVDDQNLGDKLHEKADLNFLEHKDLEYNVRILYPHTWKLIESKENIFAFQEPKRGNDDTIQENINLIMNDVSGQKVTFDQFKVLALDNLKQTVPDFILVDSSATTLAGSPAQKVVFTGFKPRLKLVQVITLKNEITYALTFVSTPTEFERYDKTVQKMVDSFQIIGQIKNNSAGTDLKKEDVKKLDVKQNDLNVISSTKEVTNKDSMAGTYRCWSYNVQGAGKSCISPPIVLNKDGTYSMSSEKGTYKITGEKIVLSESKLRGNGTLLEQGNQIRFEYDYNSWHHVMTYLKADGDSVAVENKNDVSVTKNVEVSLNIIFPESQGVSGINSASLVEKSKKEIIGEAIAYESKPHTVTALFRKLATKPGIPTGKIYTVQVSSGFGYWDAGEIDLRKVTKDVELEVYAKTDITTSTLTVTTSNSVKDIPLKKETPVSDSSQASTPPEQPVVEPTPTPAPKEQVPVNAPKCDPNIPKYSQPGCID